MYKHLTVVIKVLMGASGLEILFTLIIEGRSLIFLSSHEETER